MAPFFSSLLGLVGRNRRQVYVGEDEQGRIVLWGYIDHDWDHDVGRKVLGLASKGTKVPIAIGELPPEKAKALLELATGDKQVSRQWRPVVAGSAKGAFRFERKAAFIGYQSQRVTFLSGAGEVGVENAGVNRWGINIVAGKPYEGLLRIKPERDSTVYVSLLDASASRKLAERELKLKRSDDYHRVEFTLTPKGADQRGHFSISLKKPGSIVLGYAFLQPGAWGRFAGLPLRRDLVQSIIDQGVKVMRYDGGMVNGCPEPERYRWKEMIGPRDLRKPYRGNFSVYASHGFGIFDFLNFAEAAGILPIPGIHTGETPQDIADFVEYANGPAGSPWGRKRAADGHPAPYNLKHIEIGNEEPADDQYARRFEALAKAIWAKDPQIIPLIAHNLGNKPEMWATGPDGSVSRQLQHAVRLVRFAQEQGHPVWWDAHYSGSLAEYEKQARPVDYACILNLKQSIGKLVPGADFQIAALEENGPGFDMRRALAHARNHHVFAQMMDFIPAVAAANALGAWDQDLVWYQGKTLFTPSKAVPQPPYYVDQMIYRNWAPNVVETRFTAPKNTLDAQARKTEDGRALVLQVVNMGPEPVRASIAIEGFKPSRSVAAVTELAGDPKAVNDPETPPKAVPRRTQWDLGNANYTFPAYSFTLLRFE